ncbi:hypothetical protein BGW38_008027, partial [Lunasporangiospora selenospora]
SSASRFKLDSSSIQARFSQWTEQPKISAKPRVSATHRPRYAKKMSTIVWSDSEPEEGFKAFSGRSKTLRSRKADHTNDTLLENLGSQSNRKNNEDEENKGDNE